MELKKGYKKTEVGVIPSDWDVKTLGDVGEVRMCRRVFNDETKSQGSIPFYKIGTFGKEADAYISKDLYDNYRQRFSFPKMGDILISAAGTIGRTIIYDGKPAYFQDSNIVWLDNKGTITFNEFLYHVLQVVDYNTEGGTIQRLYNSILRNTKFICPPTKSEQTAITTALSDADALITSLERLIAKKLNIKQGAMQHLLKPKKGWEVKRLGDVVDKNIDWGFTGGPFGSNLKSSDYTKEGVRIIQLQNIGDGQFINDSEVYTTEFKANELISCNIYPDEILLSKMGDPVARACIVPRFHNRYLMCSDGIRLVVNKERYNSYFVFYSLNFPEFRSRAENASTGSTRKRIGLTELRNLEIQIPSLNEQTLIATILSDMDKEIIVLESKLKKVKNLKQGMKQNLLTGKIRLV